MRRSFGLVLIAVGVFLVIGLVLLHLVIGPAPQLAGGGMSLGITLLMALAALLLIVVGILLMRRAKPIGGTAGTGSYLANMTEVRALDGAAYEVFYQPPGTGRNPSPSSLIIRVPAATPAVLRFNRRNSYDRLCLRLGIVPAQETGDADFDAAVYIRGDALGYARQFIDDSDTRAAILTLLRQGFREVRLTGTSVDAVWPAFNPETNHHADLKDDAAAELFFLADGLPPEDPDLEGAQPDRRRARTVMLWVCASAFAALFFFAFWYKAVRIWDLVSAGLGVAAVCYPLFALIAVLLLRGASTAHDRLAPLLAVGVLLMSLGAIGGVAAVNALADDGPPDRRSVTVLKKHYTSGRYGNSYYITVHAWKNRTERVDFSVSAGEYANIAPGRSELDLTTGRGALGIEWVIERRVRL